MSLYIFMLEEKSSRMLKHCVEQIAENVYKSHPQRLLRKRHSSSTSHSASEEFLILSGIWTRIFGFLAGALPIEFSRN